MRLLASVFLSLYEAATRTLIVSFFSCVHSRSPCFVQDLFFSLFLVLVYSLFAAVYLSLHKLWTRNFVPPYGFIDPGTSFLSVQLEASSEK